jgi:uncharacterized OB-fold protein
MTRTTETGSCPRCGAQRLPDAAFCEECAYDFQGAVAEPAHHTIRAAATPDTAPAGEESPLDTGWTGPSTAPPAVASPDGRPSDRAEHEREGRARR